MHIKKDEKNFGAMGDISCKPCFGGAKAMKFLFAPSNEEGKSTTIFPQRIHGQKKCIL